jgi:hypothetical protein
MEGPANEFAPGVPTATKSASADWDEATSVTGGDTLAETEHAGRIY